MNKLYKFAKYTNMLLLVLFVLLGVLGLVQGMYIFGGVISFMAMLVVFGLLRGNLSAFAFTAMIWLVMPLFIMILLFPMLDLAKSPPVLSFARVVFFVVFSGFNVFMGILTIKYIRLHG